MSKFDLYNDNFYHLRNNKTYTAASTIVPVVLNLVKNVDSVVDFGCGVGVWLKAFKENGVNNVLGLDGEWVNKKYLEIDNKEFQEVDFENPISLNNSFSLAISLEVAEHITPENSDSFIHSIVKSSDIVLFSAAIPGQLGVNHCNEQWQSYWVEKFKKENYEVVDVIRPIIWKDESVPFWYRQNIFLYIKKEVVKELDIEYCKNTIIDLVYPHLFLDRHLESISTKGSLKLFRRSIKKKIKNLFK